MKNRIVSRWTDCAFAISCAAMILLSLVSSPVVLGQSSSTGALTGTVKDSSGAVVPNATVTATSLATDQVRTSATDANGTYKFGFLPPGTYKLKFEAAGFNAAEVPSVTIVVTETDVFDEALQVGSQTQQVEVRAETEQVQTATSTLGTTVGGTTLSDIPLTARNYSTVLGLAAGANVAVYNATQLGRGTQDIAVNGALAAQNNYQQDGSSIINTAGTGTGADSGGATSGIGIVNPDAIQEFKIQTSTYDAGYGRNPGANVNVVTKSGTNQFHGSGFEFFRNAVLNANDYFRKESAPVNGVPQNGRPVLNQNQFGGTIGGPVKKDKLFFFAGFQRTWQKNGLAAAGFSDPTLVYIPAGARSAAIGSPWVEALGAAYCGQKPFNGGIQVACDGSNINPVALNLLNFKNADGSYYVQGETAVPGTLASPGTQATTFSDPAHYFENQGVGNFDYVLNSRNTISGRFFYSSVHTVGPIGIAATSSTVSQGLPGAPGSFTFPTEYTTGKITTIVSNTVVNEVKGSVQRTVVYDYPGFVNPNGSLVTNTQFGVAPVEPTYDVTNRYTIKGLFVFGTGVAVARKLNTSWELGDQISWSHGKHTVRSGFEIERDRLNWYFPALAGGGNANETFDTFADFLLGLPGCATNLTAAQCAATKASGEGPVLAGQTNGSGFSNIDNTGNSVSLTKPGGDNHFFRSPAASVFLQDDFKVSSRVTLNLGVRWEYNGLFFDSAGNTTNTWFNLIQTVNVPVAQGGTLGATQATGSLAGFVVPSNYNASLYPPPPVGGVFESNHKVPTQNNPPIDAFAPRFGFAWRPLSSDRFVVRGGIGTFYDRQGIAAYNSSAVQIWPYAVPVFQASSATNQGSSEATPYFNVPSSVGWASGARYVTINTATNTGTSSNLAVNVMDPIYRYPTTYQWNVNTQYEFKPSWVLEVGYVGSHSVSQGGVALTGGGSQGLPLNEPLLASAAAPVNGITVNTTGNTAERVPYLGFSPTGLNTFINAGRTLFDSMQVTVRKRMSHGLELQAAYTWAQDLSTADHYVYDDPDLPTPYGRSSYYRPQRLTINYSWDLPFGKHEGLVGKVANGWSLAGVTVIQDGLPLTVTDTRGASIYGKVNTSTAEFASGMSAANVGNPGGDEARLNGWFNKAAFGTTPVIGNGTGYGNSGVGIVLGPGQFNFDSTLQKTTKVGGLREDAALVFRAEFFNAFNHAQFNTPNSVDVSTSTFGVINSSAVNPRLIQFALKYVF
ncbi:MAG: carboxypeptidase-like regulatory domain-containing protein [Candidatus Acidiferrales bacterium]